jgi:hypothetical protein
LITINLDPKVQDNTTIGCLHFNKLLKLVVLQIKEILAANAKGGLLIERFLSIFTTIENFANK